MHFSLSIERLGIVLPRLAALRDSVAAAGPDPQRFPPLSHTAIRQQHNQPLAVQRLQLRGLDLDMQAGHAASTMQC